MNAEKLHLEIINKLRDGVYSVDANRRVTFWNKAAEDITGYTKEEVIGQSCLEYLSNNVGSDGNRRSLCISGCPLYRTTGAVERKIEDEVFLRHKNGYRIQILINLFPVLEKDEVTGVIGMFYPTSPVVYDDKLIEKLSDLAMNDQLTGLANRRKTERFLEYKFHRMKHFQNKFCVIFLDLDNFALFNNTYGHEIGDKVLQKISKSTMEIIRKNDLFGRWGGEEFVGIFEIEQDYEAALIAEKIRILISNTEIPHGEAKLSVTASLGVTVTRIDDTIESVLTRADKLMYQSKHKGKNCISSDG